MFPTFDERVDVQRVRQVVGLDLRVDGGIGRGETDSAPGLGSVDDRVDGEALAKGVPSEVIVEELQRFNRGFGFNLIKKVIVSRLMKKGLNTCFRTSMLEFVRDIENDAKKKIHYGRRQF